MEVLIQTRKLFYKNYLFINYWKHGQIGRLTLLHFCTPRLFYENFSKICLFFLTWVEKQKKTVVRAHGFKLKISFQGNLTIFSKIPLIFG